MALIRPRVQFEETLDKKNWKREINEEKEGKNRGENNIKCRNVCYIGEMYSRATIIVRNSNRALLVS